LSCSLLLGNTLFEATIPLSVTLIMSQFARLFDFLPHVTMKSYQMHYQ
jgi:hypothetical protein